MKKTCSCQSKALINAAVFSNAQMGPRLYRLQLSLKGEGANLFSGFMPGQFAEFDLRNVALPKRAEIPADLEDKSGRHLILRRPFSFGDVSNIILA
jgi:hypothetical protein